MACGCGCKSKVGESSLMSGLLGALMGELAAGSRVRVGFPFQISHAISSDEIDRLEPQIVSYIQGPLYNYLNDGVTFSDVNVAVNPPGYFSDGYITVSATTRTGLPTANAFGDMVEYGIAQYLPSIYTTRRDETLIDYVAPGNVGKPGVDQAGPPKVCDWSTMDFRDWFDCQFGLGKFDQLTPDQKTAAQDQARRNNTGPGAPGDCQWSSMQFGDWVACTLGIKGAVGGITAGVTGALIGVGVLVLGGVVLLKR